MTGHHRPGAAATLDRQSVLHALSEICDARSASTTTLTMLRLAIEPGGENRGAVLIVFAYGLPLDAGVREPDATHSPLIIAQPPAATAPSMPGTVFVGRVRDKDTGKPVAQAKVNVRLSVMDPATHSRKSLTEVRQRTTAEGIYRFTMTPERLTEPTLFVDLDVDHPGYVRERHGLNVKVVNRENQPFFDDTPLEREKAIEARLLTPKGKPADGIKIGAYSAGQPLSANYHELGSFTETVTDGDGQFRLNLKTGGRSDVVFEEQKDRRFRSLMLLPDEKLNYLRRFLAGRLFFGLLPLIALLLARGYRALKPPDHRLTPGSESWLACHAWQCSLQWSPCDWPG